MFYDQNLLAQTLLSRKLIDRVAYNRAVEESVSQGKSIEEAILSHGYIDDEKLTKVKAELLRLPYINLVNTAIPLRSLKTIPKKVAENYQIIAFDKDASGLKIAMIDPQNFKAIEAVDFLAKEEDLQVGYYVMSNDSYLKAMKQYDALKEEAAEALAGFDTALEEAKTEIPKKESLETIKSAPISKIVLVVIRHAVDGRASDIHIEPTTTESRVRYRIDGILHTSLILPKYIHSAVISRIKVMANLKLDETRKPQDGRIRLTIEEKDIDFRVSTLPLYDGEKVVMRILKSQDAIPSLSDLGFNKTHVKIMESEVKKSHGMLLITGPTGSGKTSTLYTILSMLNREGVNIITLEDPVEYYINGINQSQINTEVGYTFASGLRSILRQDPNIIMLGEIRDEESTELVIQASLTGHLVLSTLHTNNSIGAVTRLMDLKAAPFLLSSTINVVLAQRLARKICSDCKKEITLPPDMLENIKKEIAEIPKNYIEDIAYKKPVFFKGQGCSFCGGSGYRGRVAIAEAIQFTQNMQEIVLTNYKINDVLEELKQQNFITFRQDGILKALQGTTALEEVFRVSQI